MMNYDSSLTQDMHIGVTTHVPAYSLQDNVGGSRCLSLVCSTTGNTLAQEVALEIDLVGMQKINPYPDSQESEMGNQGFIISKSYASDEYALIYVTKGCGELYLNKCMHEVVDIKAGMLCWIPAGQWYVCKPNKMQGCVVYYIHIRGTLIEQAINHSSLENQSAFLHIGFNEELVDLFKRASELQHSTDKFNEVYLSGIILHMVGLVLACAKPVVVQASDNEQKIEEAKAIMKENVMNDIDMNQLAMSLQLSYSWFRKLFKNYCGISPSHYFMELKIEKLKSLIVSTSIPVNELMMQLNCGTIGNFYKAFKKHTGYTPVEYRSLMSAQSTKHFSIEYASDVLSSSRLG